MKAAVFYDVQDIRLEDVPEPELGDEDVLVEVAACGICGSDLEYYFGRSPVGTRRRQGPADPRPRVLGPGGGGRQGRAGPRRGRPRRGQPDPVAGGQRPLALRQPHTSTSRRVLGRDDERRVRAVRAHEGRARLQAARLDDRRAGRVRRDAGSLAERDREGRHRDWATSSSSTAPARSGSRWSSSQRRAAAGS